MVVVEQPKPNPQTTKTKSWLANGEYMLSIGWFKEPLMVHGSTADSLSHGNGRWVR